MNFANVIPAGRYHLPHMQGTTAASTMLNRLVDNTILLFPHWRRSGLPALLRFGGRLSAINASSFDGEALSRYADDNLPKLVVCQSLSVMQRRHLRAVRMVCSPGVKANFYNGDRREAGAHQLLFNAEEDAQKPARLTIFLHLILPIIRQSLTPARLLFTFLCCELTFI
ncbi:YbjN domain-containing protein [Salmonella enterica subsp. enterica]|nr:YbjN domain-containing protein [Salmonella enterica subsp. enterica]